MFIKKMKSLIAEMNEATEKLDKAREALSKEVTAANTVAKESKQLLSKIDTAEKRGGLLLLSELDTGLIEKLQALTLDDNVIIMFTPGGERIEIKHKDTNYTSDKGRSR